MSKNIRIQSVIALLPTSLQITWRNRETHVIDLQSTIARYQSLQSLLNPTLFMTASVGEWNNSVEWQNGVDMGADTLYRLAKEQAGEYLPASAFKQWRARHDFSIPQAAQALGLNVRDVALYESEQRPIPKIVGLACQGLDHQTPFKPPLNPP